MYDLKLYKLQRHLTEKKKSMQKKRMFSELPLKLEDTFLLQVFVVEERASNCFKPPKFNFFVLLNTAPGEKKNLFGEKNYIYILDWKFGVHF